MRCSQSRKKACRQKLAELGYARFFVKWLNNTYGFDYVAKPNTEENSPIDIFAISSTGESRLNLQIVTSHGDVMKNRAKNQDAIKKGEALSVGDVNIEKWVLEAIDKKNKKYPSDIKRDLILLIAGFIPTPEPDSVRKTLQSITRLLFKGIYYVSLPVISSQVTEYTRNGFVVQANDISIGEEGQRPL